MKKIGFIVNPVAGIGGRVGLKGSDGLAALQKALELGAEPESGKKALAALKVLKNVEHLFEIYTCAGDMGANVCDLADLSYRVIDIGALQGTAQDTILAAYRLQDSFRRLWGKSTYGRNVGPTIYSGKNPRYKRSGGDGY